MLLVLIHWSSGFVIFNGAVVDTPLYLFGWRHQHWNVGWECILLSQFEVHLIYCINQVAGGRFEDGIILLLGFLRHLQWHVCIVAVVLMRYRRVLWRDEILNWVVRLYLLDGRLLGNLTHRTLLLFLGLKRRSLFLQRRTVIFQGWARSFKHLLGCRYNGGTVHCSCHGSLACRWFLEFLDHFFKLTLLLNFCLFRFLSSSAFRSHTVLHGGEVPRDIKERDGDKALHLVSAVNHDHILAQNRHVSWYIIVCDIMPVFWVWSYTRISIYLEQ